MLKLVHFVFQSLKIFNCHHKNRCLLVHKGSRYLMVCNSNINKTSRTCHLWVHRQIHPSDDAIVLLLTFDRCCWTNQHVECHMLVQYLHHSWQMKKQFLENNITFIWRKLINCSSCRSMFCGIHRDPMNSLLSTIDYNQ